MHAHPRSHKDKLTTYYENFNKRIHFFWFFNRNKGILNDKITPTIDFVSELSDLNDVKGKVAYVTGSYGGIGEAIAWGLALSRMISRWSDDGATSIFIWSSSPKRLANL